MLPRDLWKINSAQEFMRELPQVCASDSTLIHILDKVMLIKWADLQREKAREPQVMPESRAHFQHNKIKQHYLGKKKTNLQNIS